MLARKDNAIGDKLFYRYGAGYDGYQNHNKELLKCKDIMARENQIYFRECNEERFKSVLIKKRSLIKWRSKAVDINCALGIANKFNLEKVV